MKYFIYCRKSTESEDRQLLSLPAQKRALDEYAQKERLEIVDRFTESASAYKVGRPEFNKMVERLQDGEADGILVWQYNRIARNSLDGGMIVYMLDSGVLKGIRTPTGYTDGSGNSKFMLQLEFAMSKKSSDDNSESVKRGNKEKVLRGWSTKKHAGYMFVEDPSTGEKIIANDPTRFDQVKKALQLVINHKSPPGVLETLNDEWGYRTIKTRKNGGQPMSISNFYKILHSEFYAGWIYTMDGERVRGKHQAMITDREYDTIQTILGYKGKTRPKILILPYRGLMQSGECGSAIFLEEKYQLICSKCKHKFAYRAKSACPECNLAIEKMVDPTRLHYIYASCTKKKHKEFTQKTIRIEN
jgi:DNA invertase Pin-like site-specific DNA recombinase